ncbi:hypothetical protein PAECIP111893_02701 [Paenibacillus plantiphilus]|uniref:DNA 3'-5' helicase n=1 Tax=Paenibacillus plantiphilus TaxID=2905650 RepID=A0ABN8GEK3_9BACL|nr:DNA repair helicase XPB [Paenibacillus plantiphilus]CAH1207143.1 hypothetical protein PAECIP111893_02701 [Paenibacillus plantiphilus]
MNREDGPLMLQGDLTVLLDERHPKADAAREKLSQFADLIKRPGHIHTYRMTPLSLWNAAASQLSAADIIAWLKQYSRYELPLRSISQIRMLAERYGQLMLERSTDGGLLLHGNEVLLQMLSQQSSIRSYLSAGQREGQRAARADCRGLLKQELVRLGYPVVDGAGYRRGEELTVGLRCRIGSGSQFELRDYQEHAVNMFYRADRDDGGSGVLVLPCGAGKTVIGIAAIARLGCETLILTSNVTSVKQWKQELIDKTTLADHEIGEYAASCKQVCPVTIATYQILTYKHQRSDEYAHMKLFQERNWGLIIYDEVHLLPAPVFRMTADLQATRRLGLTATLIREDGREEDVFSLIGPKRFDMPWKTLESAGAIAAAECFEIRVPFAHGDRAAYDNAEARTKARLAGENKEKLETVKWLLSMHPGRQILIIGQYLQQLHAAAAALHAPLLTGELPHQEREKLYKRFKDGEIEVLVVSKVANFAVDLPDAAVAIQLSGSYGSRQEEAQRIGRILRPKRSDNRAWFYTLVTEGTKETEFARKRQLFMLEQGYPYDICCWQPSIGRTVKESPAQIEEAAQ